MNQQLEALKSLGLKMEDLGDIFTKQEELRPELKKFLCTVSGMPAVKHPLIYSVPHFENTNAWLNVRYEILKKAFDKAVEEEDHGAILSLTERPYRVEAFYNLIAYECSPRQYWKMMGELYTDSENIYQNVDIWEELLFGGHVKTLEKSFMGRENTKLFRELPDEMTIYRGTQTDYWRGFSWTLDKDKAEWFARRYSMPSDTPTLTTATVLKSDVLGYFNGRNEKEVVCHFDNVTVISHETLP